MDLSNVCKISKKTVFSLLIMWIWIQSLLLQYIRAIFMRLPIIGQFPDAIIMIVTLVLIGLSLSEFIITRLELLSMMVIYGLVLLRIMMVGQEYPDVETYLVNFMLKVLPLYFVGVNLAQKDDQEDLVHKLYILSVVTLVADMFYKLYVGAPMTEVASKYAGDMDRAYKILPHCCMIAYFAIMKSSLINRILTVVGAVYLLMLGTRGAAIIYLLFITVMMIKGKTGKWVIARFSVIATGITAFFMSPLFMRTLIWLNKEATELGLSVRIFDKFLVGELTASSGRDTISETLLNAIAENPILGYGLCSDRIFTGTYAHNIVIELWVEFGVVFGTIFLAVLLVTMIRGYIKADNDSIRGMIILLAFSCFLKLFLSGTYISESLLFFLIGLCIGTIRRSRYRDFIYDRVERKYENSTD